MRVATMIFYFVFAIMFLGSIGVFLPYIFDNVNNDPNKLKNLNQNLVTYLIAILVSASLDYVMRLMDESVPYKKLAILLICILNALVFGITGYILYQNSVSSINGISAWAIFSLIIAYVMWWVANSKNSAFNVSSPLGGDAGKPLTNG